MPMRSGWIGVDLDGTLAQWDPSVGLDTIGPPVPLMLERVKKWLDYGQNVRIVTARVAVTDYVDSFEALDFQRTLIEEWCLKHLGMIIPITATKDYTMTELWDDRAVQVVPNTGERVDGR